VCGELCAEVGVLALEPLDLGCETDAVVAFARAPRWPRKRRHDATPGAFRSLGRSHLPENQIPN